MSNLNSSLALEEVEEQHIEPKLNLVDKRYLSIINDIPEAQPIVQVVKITGSITVSF